MVIAGALLVPVVASRAQTPGATEHPIPTTPPGADATRPPGPWVDPPAPPTGCQPEDEANDQPADPGVRILPTEFCVSGTLEAVRDQDLYFWEVPPEDGLTTWQVSVRGVPTTFTSVHVFDLDSAVGVTPIDMGGGNEVARVDSDVWVGTPVPTSDLRLAPGPYLLGISRAEPGYKQDVTDDLSYWVELRRGPRGTLPSGDAEPNDDVETAVPIDGAASFGGDAGGTRDVYRWQVLGGDATPWRVAVEAAPGSSIDLMVTDLDQQTIARTDVDTTGHAALEDLGLATGAYLIWIDGNAGVDPYTLTVERAPQDVDPEPNDVQEQAVVLDPATLTATGRLTSDGDRDRYWADIDRSRTDELTDISLTWSDGRQRGLCIGDDQGSTIACGSGSDGIQLRGLLLSAGRYLLTVDGSGGPEDRYTLAVRSSGIPQPPREVEPNDDATTAQPVSGAFVVGGDVASGPDMFAWTLSDAEASGSWHLDLSTTLGARGYLTLRGPDGSELTSTTTADTGDGRLWDLRLAPGTWTIEVEAASSVAPAYVLRAVQDTDTDVDAEPNDRVAVPMDAATLTAHGRLAGDGDRDLWSFELPATMAGTLTTVELTWPGTATRSLCIRTGAGTFVQCAEGVGSAVLSSLDLEAGPYALEVTGGLSPATRYELRVRPGPVRSADAESEPNDADGNSMADPWDPALAMHGTARDGDPDVFLVRVPPGIPHRWQLTVLGTGLDTPAWRQPDGALAGTPAVTDDGSMATIEDLLLVSGDHTLTITGHGDYVLTLVDQGALDPTAETEPNDVPERAGLLPWDSVRHGRLAAPTDVDIYRFSLAAPEHVRLTAVPDDREGGTVAAEGIDLGPLDEDDPRGLVDLQVVSATTILARVPGTTDATPVVLDAMLPAGDHEVWLRTAVRGGAGYTLQLERDDPFLVPGAAAPAALPVSLTLDTPTTQVAAHVVEGQRVDGILTIANEAAAALELDLRAVTSDLRWTIELPPTATIAAGATLEVPFRVHVPADAWRDIPVRVSVAARTQQGAQATASLDLTPVQDVAPVAPEAAWGVPDALLGGIDVASAAFGGVPGDTWSDEELIHDGYAVAGTGLHAWLTQGPVEITVDLAGDDPVPVAGTILDATALYGTLGARPRVFELWLSPDGTTWGRALRAQASTLTTEQAFVLPAPVEARSARLVVRSNWGDPQGSLDLGEWKVVAAPGWAPAEELDVAAGALGGHVVWTAPDRNDRDLAAIVDDTDTELLDDAWYEEGTSQELVIGLRADRAAQVTRLEWVEEQGTDPALRFGRAQVSASTGSPFGPWRSLGTWDLGLRPDGTVAPFELPEETWARFVHLTLEPPPDQERGYRTLPAQVRIIERATDDSYRTILGEWGQSSPRGPFEALAAETDVAAAPDAVDGPDDPADASVVGEGEQVRGQVARGQDVDWYRLTVPEGDNELTLRLRMDRARGIRLTVLDDQGRPAPFRETGDPATGERVWKAYVRPGETYRVGLEQPILSVVISFDTSGSVEPWWPLIRAAVRTFVDDITPGLEAGIVLPFQEAPLPDDWTDQPWLIRAALDARSSSSGSSCLACALQDAAGRLDARDGERALLVLGDAVGAGLAGGLDEVRLAATGAAIFPVHFGAAGDESLSSSIMQDLAATNGGFYQYATSTGEVDRAFDRMATWLRRPAGYTFSWDADVVPPGAISVVAAEGAEVRIGGVAVELVLDTSGSMRAELGDSTRIAVAKRSLRQLVESSLPEGLPVALRTFKAGRRSCDTTLAVELGPLDRAAMAERIRRLKIDKGTRTPLAAAIAAVADDIGDVPGPRIVVVVTDGAETCKGDPEAAVRSLVDAGFDTTVNIVGFALDDEALKARMAGWADIGGGVFLDAQDQAGLSAGIAAALRAPFRIIDADGTLVGEGLVGDAPVTVQPGTYRVEVLSEPPAVFEQVEVASGSGAQLTVGEPAE
jgi:hypothetical protein